MGLEVHALLFEAGRWAVSLRIRGRCRHDPGILRRRTLCFAICRFVSLRNHCLPRICCTQRASPYTGFPVLILATILIAARSGAAVASDVGSKVYGNQLDAMKTIGVDPYRLLRTPVLYAFLIGRPSLRF